MAQLGVLYWKQGKLEQSIPMFEATLTAQVASLGRQHPTTLRTIANLAVNYKDAGRLAEAVRSVGELLPLPRVELEPEAAHAFRHGSARSIPDGGSGRVSVWSGGALLGIGSVTEGTLQPEKVMPLEAGA